MTDFAMFANALTYAQVRSGSVWAKAGSTRAVLFPTMAVGDTLIPLFDRALFHGDVAGEDLASIANEEGVSAQDIEEEYRADVGAGSVPYLLRVTSAAQRRNRAGEDIFSVEVRVDQLTTPLPVEDFLRLRALEDSVAAQLKGSTPLNPIVESRPGLAEAVMAAAEADRDEDRLLRRFSVVNAETATAAIERLVAAGRMPIVGDRVFLATRSVMPGVTVSSADGELAPPTSQIANSPESAMTILREAQIRATAEDNFQPDPAIAAIEKIVGLLQSGDSVLAIDDYREFYEFTILSRQITRALGLRARHVESDSISTPDTDSEYSELTTNLAGLTVEAVVGELPQGFFLPRPVIASAVTALRAGKHLLLGGPPGTGKTTLAEALCRAVVDSNFHVTTATADWTTFDTIGGYLPDNGGLQFEPGVVLRSLKTAGWLVIDEVNRADIDKAFGPLFTVLSGSDGTSGRISTLPYKTEDGPVVVKWASHVDQSASVYTITPTWRLIGTLNLSDKASLFRLSFAFLRRFAVIDVPLPDETAYRSLFAEWFTGFESDMDFLLDVMMSIVVGPVPIGPAIGRDMARFIVEGLAESSSGTTAMVDLNEALLSAVRLFVVPQYEGETAEGGRQLVQRMREALPLVDPLEMEDLLRVLDQVAI